MSRIEANELLRESPVALPGRIAVAAGGVAGCRVGVYVIDIDGSCLIRLAGDNDAFPERVMAPVGVGPEIALESLPAVQEICASRLPASVAVAMVARDRAIGVLVCERRPCRDLRRVAEQAALALELTSGYTDVVHAARRRKEKRGPLRADRRKRPSGAQPDPWRPRSAPHGGDCTTETFQ